MFDVIIALVLLVSCGVGFLRGAGRELAALVALVVAGAIAVLSTGLSTAIVSRMIQTPWLAKSTGMMAVFLIVYVVVRMFGISMAKRIHKTELGSLDRVVGLGFGLIRGLVVLGVFNIVLHTATPAERMPGWVTDAALYPLTAVSADALKAMAPKGAGVVDRVAPALKRAIDDSGDTPPEEIRDKSPNEDYDPAHLTNTDNQAETPR